VINVIPTFICISSAHRSTLSDDFWIAKFASVVLRGKTTLWVIFRKLKEFIYTPFRNIKEYLSSYHLQECAQI